MIVPAVPLREHVAQSEAQDGAEVQVNASAPSVSQLSSAEAQESAGAPAEAQDDDGSDTASGSEDEALDLEEHARRIIDGRRRD